MDFLVNNIWAILLLVVVLWIGNKLLTSTTGEGDHIEKELLNNEKLREMEDGNFSDEDLKKLLPNQKILVVSMVRKKYGMGLGEALNYVDNLENGEAEKTQENEPSPAEESAESTDQA